MTSFCGCAANRTDAADRQLGVGNVRQMTEYGGNRLSRVLFQELRRLGYEEGRNLTIERYTLEGRVEALGSVIDQIAASRPDLIYMDHPLFAKRFIEAGVIGPHWVVRCEC